jgi:hypothetical protein
MVRDGSTLLLDVESFLSLFLAFFQRESIPQEGQAPMSEFMGSGSSSIILNEQFMWSWSFGEI